jgi:hypothetical protein
VKKLAKLILIDNFLRKKKTFMLAKFILQKMKKMKNFGNVERKM